MNTPLNVPGQTLTSQPKGPVRYRLSSLSGQYETPYIEHWVLQLHGVSADRIDHPDALNATLDQVVADLDLTQVTAHSHYFGPGVSTVIILSESHLSAHTWPELGYLHLDLVTCVRKLTADKLQTVLRAAFAPQEVVVAQLEY